MVLERFFGMLPHWSPLVMLLVIGAVVGIAGWIVMRRARFQEVKQTSVRCPVHGESYEASVLEDVRTGERLAVLGCSAWHDWKKAGCDARCLRCEDQRSV